MAMEAPPHRRCLLDILRPRWDTIPGAKIPLAHLIELAQRITLDALYFHNVNDRRLEMRLHGRRSDLRFAAVKRIVQDVVTRSFPRLDGDHDAACAALLAINVQTYRRWALSNDQHVNR